MTELDIKAQLLSRCADYVAQRLANVRAAMAAAQASANTEGKSSAGDKYETGRAMMQLERDLHAKQLAEALKLQKELAQITAAHLHQTAQPGSVVITEHQRFFLGIGAGKLTLGPDEYFAVSLASPIGAKLHGLRVGGALVFNNRRSQIIGLF